MTGPNHGATPRRRGDRFELLTRHAFEAAGWYVIKSGGSLGIADLVALRRGEAPLLLSCKLTGNIYSTELAKLVTVARGAGALAVLAQRNSGRSPYVELFGVPRDAPPVLQRRHLVELGVLGPPYVAKVSGAQLVRPLLPGMVPFELPSEGL